MDAVLTPEQRERRDRCRAFAEQHVAPEAARWDREQQIPEATLRALGRDRWFGAAWPENLGGLGWDTVSFGLLHEAIGRHDSALAGFLTIQSMVGLAVNKWGSPGQKEQWLPRLARGETLASFALTEPAAGSDFAGFTTELVPRASGGYCLRGEKKWVSGSQSSDVFLVFARCEGQSAACLVPRGAPGFTVDPIRELMGFRAAGLGRLTFADVPVSSDAIVGRIGFAFSHVAPTGLHYGRLSTTCSALGLLRGCVEESARYASKRTIAGHPEADLGMIQTLLARPVADLEAAQCLCWSACAAEDRHSPDAYRQAFIAKYFTSRAAVRAASDAVQVHGAAGVHESSPVSRFYRAAKIMELIEGTTQIHEAVIAQELVKAYR
ncbi:MAG TPA: acyl-CoA dehydrogenase family protein [Opitutaceae bacterium]